MFQDAKVLEEVLEVKETLLQEKAVSEEMKKDQTEHQDVLKALVIHQDQEDTNHLIIFKYKIPKRILKLISCNEQSSSS